MVSSLLSRIGVITFEPIIRARAAVIGPLGVSIDGGAGWGDTARTIASSTSDDGVIYAFEPFPGNHRFFEGIDHRVKLIRSAISDHVGTASFVVPRVVDAADAWAERGMVGYSSVGHLQTQTASPFWKRFARRTRALLMNKGQGADGWIQVETTRIDASISDSHFDFVKLDLQGGELPALKGMGRSLQDTDLIWLEFSNQPGLLAFLLERDFVLFDTNYLCTKFESRDFRVVGLKPARQITLSTSQTALLATRYKESDKAYSEWFSAGQRDGYFIQADLLAVNEKFLEKFLLMLGVLGTPQKMDEQVETVEAHAEPAIDARLEF